MHSSACRPSEGRRQLGPQPSLARQTRGEGTEQADSQFPPPRASLAAALGRSRPRPKGKNLGRKAGFLILSVSLYLFVAGGGSLVPGPRGRL